MITTIVWTVYRDSLWTLEVRDNFDGVLNRTVVCKRSLHLSKLLLLNDSGKIHDRVSCTICGDLKDSNCASYRRLWINHTSDGVYLDEISDEPILI